MLTSHHWLDTSLSLRSDQTPLPSQTMSTRAVGAVPVSVCACHASGFRDDDAGSSGRIDGCIGVYVGCWSGWWRGFSYARVVGETERGIGRHLLRCCGYERSDVRRYYVRLLLAM